MMLTNGRTVSDAFRRRLTALPRNPAAWVMLGLTVLSFVQRPGRTTFDTKLGSARVGSVSVTEERTDLGLAYAPVPDLFLALGEPARHIAHRLPDLVEIHGHPPTRKPTLVGSP